MAKLFELNEEGWNEWVAVRPAVVQELCKRLPPDRLYLLKPTGQRVTIVSYAEGGTVTVDVSGEYNFMVFDRQVFGINPDDLVECDLPTEEDLVGTLLTEEADVKAYIDASRAAVLAEREKH